MKIWQCVVWLSAVTLEVSHSQSPDREEWITEALDLYNQREDGEFLFKLLSELPAPLLEEEGDSPEIGFLIKETDCPKSEEIDLERCDYSKDGPIATTSAVNRGVNGSKPLADGWTSNGVLGFLVLQEVKVCALHQEEQDVKCVSLTAENSRSKRSSKKKKCKFFCKVKKKIKSIGFQIPIVSIPFK